MKRLASGLCVLVALLAVILLSASGQGFAQQPRVEHFVDDDGPSFSPDGRTITFSRFFSTSRYGVDPHPVARRAVILLMGADGSRKRVLRHAGATFEYSPSFSPDGRSILFVRDDRIYLMRRDGSGPRPVRPDFLEQACPQFSPDGRRISFWRGRGGKSGAYFVMSADGSGLRRISNSGGQIFHWGCPSWFPDGKRLVFAKNYNLYVASVDGTSIERITDDKDGTLYRPSVSPDGRWIACDGNGDGGDGIIVMRADGKRIRRITTAPNEIENDAAAGWSPGGTRIALTGERSPFKNRGVYVVNRDGSGFHRLSNPTR